MQFNVPQFETEDKLFGPFTVAQFLYVSATLVISFFLFPILTTWFWLITSAILIGGSLMLALVKIGGRPMIIFLSAAAHYLWEPKTLTQPLKLTGITSLTEAHSALSAKTTIPNRSEASSIATPSLPLASPVVPSPFPVMATSSTPATVTTNTAPSLINISMPDKAAPPTESIKNISPLRNIFDKMLTYSSSIPVRETSFIQATTKKQGCELVQKPTGETIVARRVDYR